jgi:hypothetical protein
MKEHKPDENSWVSYLNKVKEKLDKVLEKEDYSTCMTCYINSVSVENCINKLGETK